MISNIDENKTDSYTEILLSFLYDCFVKHHKKRVLRRWKNHRKQRPHDLPNKLIVSLTSYPKRFETLPLTVKCLLTQTVKPDSTILWISHKDKEKLTEDILCLENQGLEIMYCEDLKSYKKIIPALRLFPDAFIVTADDDAYYWQTWLEELVAKYSGDNNEVLCHRAHEILLNDDKVPLPYNQWRYNINYETCSPVVFPTGLGGVLYPPDVFHSDVMNEELFMSLCPSADDVWLYWMSRLNGSKARKLGGKRKFVLWPETQKTALAIENHLNNVNDLRIESMVKKYGFPQ